MTPDRTSSTVRWIGSRPLLVLAVVLFTAAMGPARHAVPAALGAPAFTYASLPPYTPAPPHQYKPDVPLSRGMFLVASRGMKDPRFSETVIILLEYGRRGAIGLIINRPTKVGLSKALPGVKRTEQHPWPIYFGGPVGMGQMRMLFQSASQPGDANHVFEDVYVSSSMDLLQRLVDGQDSEGVYRVYAGYAGWAPQQLDQEVLRGGWHVFSGDAEAIFNKEASTIWPELISSP